MAVRTSPDGPARAESERERGEAVVAHARKGGREGYGLDEFV